MKILFLLITIVSLFLTNNVFAQKLYVWCPKEQIITLRKAFLEHDTIDLVIFDGRLLTKNSRVECTSENTVAQLGDYIKKTYASTTINLLSSNDYYKDPTKNRITIKVGISAYHAAFGTDIKMGIGSVGSSFTFGVFPEGKWNALTAYTVKVYDYRNGKEIKQTKDISKLDSKSNMFGYSSAKSILNSTYMQANQEMLFFIDEALMK
jgi:hypothetical protein